MVRKIKKGNKQSSTNDLISKAKTMQDEMLKVTNQLSEEIIEHSVAGGSITVKVNGVKKILDIHIDNDILKDAVEDKDSTMISKLIIEAVNGAIDKAEALSEERMSSITGGLSIPGLF